MEGDREWNRERHPTCQQDHQASSKGIWVLCQPHRAHGCMSTQKPPHLLAKELVKGSTPGPGNAGCTWGEVMAVSWWSWDVSKHNQQSHQESGERDQEGLIPMM